MGAGTGLEAKEQQDTEGVTFLQLAEQDLPIALFWKEN